MALSFAGADKKGGWKAEVDTPTDDSASTPMYEARLSGLQLVQVLCFGCSPRIY